MRKKIFLMLFLICATAQGLWAQSYDVWDGTSTRPPSLLFYFQGGKKIGEKIGISSAAQLAYIRDHWTEVFGSMGKKFYQHEILLDADLDMSAVSWTPLNEDFEGTFNGQNHTIKLKIENVSDNNEGLFREIAEGGLVVNLRIAGKIDVGNARKVGGICGDNYGTIRNCWVSADVKSSHYSSYDADLGGIAGLNEGTIEFCCMSGNVTNTGGNSGVGGIAGGNDGTIRHCTFYGTVSVNHNQDSKYVGEQDGTMQYTYDSFSDDELASYIAGFNGTNVFYSEAIRHPYAISITNTGHGSLVASPAKCRPGTTVTLTWAEGTTLEGITIQDADGNNIDPSGSYSSNFTFTMPHRDVHISTLFNTTIWDNDDMGTQENPYIIDKLNEWVEFVNHVNAGNSYSGKYVKLTTDLDVTQMCGIVSGSTLGNAFSGTFLGEGHTITANITDVSNQGTALFAYINGATIRDLKVAGNINGGMYAAALVGFAAGTCSIENCVASANVAGGTHMGGLLGNALDGSVTISRCVYKGRMTGGATAKGAIVGWGEEGGSRSISNSLYLLQEGQNTDGLDFVRHNGGTTAVADDCYKTTSAGTYAYCVGRNYEYRSLYAPVKAVDDNTYYMPIGTPNVSISSTTYQMNKSMNVPSRIIVRGNIILNLAAGTTLNAPKGIEVSAVNAANLTINGPGTLNINGCDYNKSGIGAENVGTLIINSGTINVYGGSNAAGIGGDAFNSTGGSITINGGVVNAWAGYSAAGIGSGFGRDEVNLPCGDIVINGGQVSAYGYMCYGIGPGMNHYASDAGYNFLSGTLTLGWTNEDDFIFIGADNIARPNRRVSSVSYVPGKQLYLQHTQDIAGTDNIYGVILKPVTGPLPSLSGSGTEDNPYLINNDDDWLLFQWHVNSGDTNFSGQYVKLNNDITASSMIGVREDRPFSGTFDGGGHTLTFNFTRSSYYQKRHY